MMHVDSNQHDACWSWPTWWMLILINMVHFFAIYANLIVIFRLVSSWYTSFWYNEPEYDMNFCYFWFVCYIRYNVPLHKYDHNSVSCLKHFRKVSNIVIIIPALLCLYTALEVKFRCDNNKALQKFRLVKFSEAKFSLGENYLWQRVCATKNSRNEMCAAKYMRG